MNQVHIEPTKFTDVRTGEEHLGFRAWDDEGQTYDNSWDSIPDTDDEFLKRVFRESCDAAMCSLLEYCVQYEKGIFIGNKYITFSHWRKLKAEVDAEN